jgi:transposase
MRYPQGHWLAVAQTYKDEIKKVHPTELTGGKTIETVTISKVQNHYPHVTEGTVATWIRRCRREGLL